MPKRSATNSASSSTGNYANKEPRRSSSTASCVHGRDVSQCKEYGRGSITSIIPTERSDAPQDSSTSLSSSSSSSSSSSLPTSFSSSSSSFSLPFSSTIESLSQEQNRSTRLEFLAKITCDRSEKGDDCDIDDDRDPQDDNSNKGSDFEYQFNLHVHIRIYIHRYRSKSVFSFSSE